MRVKRFFKYSGIGIGILLGAVLVSGQIAYNSVPMIEPPGSIYSVNGADMHIYCTGPEDNMQPTIVIIAGGGVTSPLYYPLQENLSQTVRTCTYDRSGTGWSEPNGMQPHAKNMSDELHGLLGAAEIDGPIILAGHSLGGIVSLVYSAEHPEQVAAIAFIDSSHYNQYDYFGEEFSDAIYKQNDELLANFWMLETASKLGIVSLLTAILENSDSEVNKEGQRMFAYFDRWTPLYDTMKSEVANIKPSFEQGKEAHYPRGSMPIVSLSASDHDTSVFPKTGPTEQDLRESYKSFREDLASLSDNGIHVTIEGTDHMSIIQNDETAEHILSLAALVGEE